MAKQKIKGKKDFERIIDHLLQQINKIQDLEELIEVKKQLSTELTRLKKKNQQLKAKVKKETEFALHHLVLTLDSVSCDLGYETDLERYKSTSPEIEQIKKTSGTLWSSETWWLLLPASC